MSPVALILVILLAASELLANVPAIAENSIFQLVVRAIRFLKDKVAGPFSKEKEVKDDVKK